VNRAGNVFLVPLVFLTNINDYRFTAFQLGRGFSWRNLSDVFLRFRDELLEFRVLSP
jgi:hypothetical protein